MESKICSKCKKEKTLKEFLYRNKKEGTFHSACKVCYKEIRKKSYNKNKQTTYERNKRNRQKSEKWLKEYKEKLKCSQCDENHISCLEFHHLEKDKKEYNVSKMIKGYSIEKIKKEIKKCIVLCSNCHKKHHYYNKK